jgi:hypothetical protein
MQAAPHSVSFHADSNQIIARKAVQSIVPANSHAPILRFLKKKNLEGLYACFIGDF